MNETALDGPYFTNNYKFGFSFEYPLFLRGERGKYQLNKLKRMDVDLIHRPHQLQNRIPVQIIAPFLLKLTKLSDRFSL